mmetsp:Transcript_57284/g.101205  ORF Transcript_57284/g.101205 Transcript_57284/m.101205 type:complete len:181 (+) Transcript_57284:123-665(+)
MILGSTLVLCVHWRTCGHVHEACTHSLASCKIRATCTVREMSSQGAEVDENCQEERLPCTVFPARGTHSKVRAEALPLPLSWWGSELPHQYSCPPSCAAFEPSASPPFNRSLLPSNLFPPPSNHIGYRGIHTGCASWRCSRSAHTRPRSITLRRRRLPGQLHGEAAPSGSPPGSLAAAGG